MYGKYIDGLRTHLNIQDMVLKARTKFLMLIIMMKFPSN